MWPVSTQIPRKGLPEERENFAPPPRSLMYMESEILDVGLGFSVVLKACSVKIFCHSLLHSQPMDGGLLSKSSKPEKLSKASQNQG